MTIVLNPPVRRVEWVEASAPRLTYDDFMRLAPADDKAELIQGMFIVMPPPLYTHERLQGFLLTVLRLLADFWQAGQVLGSRTAVRLDEHQVYEPDVLFISRDRQHIITERAVVGAPDWVIEILSASTAHHDRGIKREWYDRAGVRELWLVDPYGPAGTQFFQRQGDQLVEVAPVNGIIQPLAWPEEVRFQTAWLWPDEAGNLPNTLTVLQTLGIFPPNR